MVQKSVKFVAIWVALWGFSASVMAQTEGQYTHFMFNRLSYNPAYAGSMGNLSISALYNNQWMGLKLQAPVPELQAGVTPTNILATFDMPVKFLHGGIGLSFNSTQVGYHKDMYMGLDYAFRIFWGPGSLSAGVEVNLDNYTYAKSNLRGSDDLSGLVGSSSGSSSDPLVGGGDVSEFLFDVSTGIYYQVPNQYYVGLAVKNLLASSSSTLNYGNVRTFYLIGGYDFTIPYNPSFKLKPSVLIKSNSGRLFQAEAACLLDYEDFLWGGLGYRLTEAFTFLAGVNIHWSDSWLRIGLAYDLTSNKLGAFKPGRSIGSLELFANFSFQIITPKKPPTVSRTTRYTL